MEDMTKYQLVLLVLLVSFVTALVTGIVTVTLVNQAPAQVTNTIQKVIERSIGTASVVPQPLPQDAQKELETSALARDVLIEDIANRVSPAVVSIAASSTEQKQVSAGSGFFISADGMILTNRHVVEDKDADYTVIMNNGKKLSAKVLAYDPLKDVAVLKIDPPSGGEKFSFIALGDSDMVKIGQTAIAIGSAPGETQNTLSIGVISGFLGAMQTDAEIDQGNSGGPLLNLKGEAIGLNTAVADESKNIGFAIPINQVKRAIASTSEAKTNF